MQKEDLGKGRLGVVYSGMLSSHGTTTDCAFKLVEAEAKNQNAIKKELEFIRMLGELQGTVKVHATLQTKDFVLLVMDRLKGDVKELNHSLPFSAGDEENDNSLAFDMLRQLSETLYTMHKAGVYHKDLKPANILYRDKNEGVSKEF